MGDQKVCHSGSHDVVDDVIEGAYEVQRQFERLDGQRDVMKSQILRPYEQMALAQAALTYRYDITASQLLAPQLIEDRSDDLWTTFNCVPENVIKGGLRGKNNANRRTTTRAVSGIDQDLQLNCALWVLAEALRNQQAA